MRIRWQIILHTFFRHTTRELVNKTPEQPVAEPLDPRQRIDVGDYCGPQVEPVPLAPAETGPQAA